MSLIGAFALAVVAAQLLATLAFQFAPLKSRFYRLDAIGALPRWLFFVPGSGSLDHAIVARGRRTDGTLGAWRTIWEMPARRAWNWLWSPDPDGDQTIWFAVATLDQRIARGRTASTATSHAYALILDQCRRRTRHDPGFADHQFALVRIDRDGAWRKGFTSPFHAP